MDVNILHLCNGSRHWINIDARVLVLKRMDNGVGVKVKRADGVRMKKYNLHLLSITFLHTFHIRKYLSNNSDSVSVSTKIERGRRSKNRKETVTDRG